VGFADPHTLWFGPCYLCSAPMFSRVRRALWFGCTGVVSHIHFCRLMYCMY